MATLVHGGVKLLFRSLGAVATIALVAAGFLVWRLGQGPLSLSLLTPYLEDVLVFPQAGARLRLGETQIVWGDASRALELRVRDVAAVDPNGGVLAEFAELGLTLEPTALLSGRLRPRAIEVLHPHLRLIRQEDGAVRLGLQSSPELPVGEPAPGVDAAPVSAPVVGETTTGAASALAAVLGALDERQGMAGVLRSIALTDADVEVIDRQSGGIWRIPALSLDARREGGGIGVSADVRLDLDPTPTRLTLAGQYQPGSGALALRVDVDTLRPAALAALHRDLRPLGAVDMPISGTVTLGLTALDPAGAEPVIILHRVGADLSTASGTLRLPAPLDTDYPVQGARLRGAYDLDRQSLTVDDLVLTLEGATVAARLALAPKTGGGLDGSASIDLGPLSLATLKRYWPLSVAPNPREWVVDNMIDGHITSGNWTIGLGGPDLAGLDVTALEGRAFAERATVAYLAPMPVATNASAELGFALDRVEIRSLRGQVNGLKVTRGDIVFRDLHLYDNFADISLGIEGPLTDALKLLDSRPLGYPRKLGLDPAKGRGDTVTDLTLSFPLLKDLKLDDLKVRADARVRNGILRGAVFGQDLTEGDITLGVDTSALEAKGTAQIGGVPMDFTWRENFAGKPFASRYTATAQVAEDKRGMFGLTFPPFTPTYLAGPAAASLVYTVQRDRTALLEVQADLTPARIWVPGFEHEKPVGAPAKATAQVRLLGDRIVDVPQFSVTAEKLRAEGAVTLTADQGLKTLTLTAVELGDSRFSGTMTRMKSGEGFEVDVRGPFLDATPFLGTRRSADDVRREPPPLPEVAEDGSIDDGLPPLILRGFFDRVKTSEDLKTRRTGLMSGVQASANRVGGRWQTARIDGDVVGGAAMSFILGPDPGTPGQRRYTARTEDAGALLRAMDVLGTMRGGKLWAEGSVNRKGVAEGQLSIDGYRLVEAPILAKLLSVAALTGILDALTGEGIVFDRLEAPFTYDSDREYLQFRQFRTFGTSLGLTGSGSMDFRADVIDGAGTMVPFFVFNSLVGKIPVLGDLLTGFEKDGGLFAASYTVRGAVSDPDISVNPLSALAPGFLRKLFNFDFGAAQPAPEVSPPPGDSR